MKTYCKPKTVNIEDYHFNTPAVSRCICAKEKRKDFGRMVLATGVITKSELRYEIENGEFNKRSVAWEAVAKNLTQRIINRDLELPEELRVFERADNLSGKIRQLTKEDPEQQCYEYMAVEALMPLFKAKFLPFQYGSVPGRGQVAGARRLERILRKKFRGDLDCVKCDVRHAYKSTKVELVMALLERDIGKNKTLLWFLKALMANYPGGVLIIGGYLPTWLFNYVMSYFLRYLMSVAKVRRGKSTKIVKDIVCYADDYVIFGKAKSLIWLMRQAEKWINKNLGLSIKQGWLIIYLPSYEDEKIAQRDRDTNGTCKRTQGIDMMGYVVRRRYTIVRKRIYKRVRRNLLRAKAELDKYGYVPWWRAQVLMSYKGYIDHTDSRLLGAVLDSYDILKASKYSLSNIFGRYGMEEHY